MRRTAEGLSTGDVLEGYATRSEARHPLCSIIGDLDAIDSSINEKSRSWKTGRMPKVDLAIMRLAIGEIRFDDTVPQAVAINRCREPCEKIQHWRNLRIHQTAFSAR